MQSILEKLRYEPETGQFYWLIDACTNVLKGDLAGCTDKHGYRRIVYRNKVYKCHRLAWSLHNNYVESFPQIDHVNGNRSDNRIENLRISSPRENSLNRKCHREGRLPGCHEVKTKNGSLWRVAIVINKQRLHIGCYESQEVAHMVYLMATNFYGVEVCI